MSGFVFIEGRYIQPPYTVTRKGNGIFVNRIQVEQMPWGHAAPEEAQAAAPSAKKSVDADGDFEEVAAVAPAPAADPVVAVDPFAPKKAVKSIDDLFDDEEPAKPAEAPAAPVAAPQQAAPAVAPAVAEVVRDPDTLKREREASAANLDRVRKGYEQSLARGDMFFFGQRHSRLNGNYGTARTLMGVLPKALRYAQSPSDLLQRLKQGGVYFIDLSICTELYRNKLTFPLLEERLVKIETNEALDARRRREATAW